MNRNDIVIAVYNNKKNRAALPKKTIRDMLDFVIQEMTDDLLAGNDVKLTGFGTFCVRSRKDRVGRNPKTGSPLLIKSHKAIVFRPTRKFWT